MGVDRRDIEALIKQHGGKLVRSKRHLVYKFPDGRCFTLSSTPSDVFAERNNLTNLRRLLGIERKVNKNPDRKPKVGVNGKPAFTGIATGVTMRDWRTDLNLQARKLHLFKPKGNCIGYLQRVPMTPLTAILAHFLWN